MKLARDFRQTVGERLHYDSAFANALLVETGNLFLNGESQSARLVLRDLVNATIGFEALAEQVSISSKSLHRMLSKDGNPRMNNIAAIFSAISKNFDVHIAISIAKANKRKRILA